MQEIIEKARRLAINEINKFGVPNMEHFILANQKGQEIAVILKADREVVLLGTMLMDLKLGQCLKENRLGEHVKESSARAQKFLKRFPIEEKKVQKIISCIESHHGLKQYNCLEAEICANADCYRFLSPRGFFNGLMVYSRRGLNFNDSLLQIEKKISEKQAILSLDYCKKEIGGYYQEFKKLIIKARES